jgi:hypothetical protein
MPSPYMSQANTTNPASAKPARTAARVVVEPAATVNDENTGPLVAARRVDRKKSVEPRVAVAVRDLLGLNRHHALIVMRLLVGE